MRSLREAALPLALLFAASLVLVVGLYARARNYELVWMDETEIGEGAILVAPDESWASAFTRPLHRGAGVNPYYRPLQIVVATGIHRVAGSAPAPYRVVLLGFAVATCTIFGVLAWFLFGSLPLALLAVALAAAHPAMIESWVWISGLGEAMAAFFAIASVGLGVLALGRTGRTRLAFAALSTAALVLALFSKEKAVVTPLLLGLVWLAAALRNATPRAVFADRAALRSVAMLAGVQVAIVLFYVVAWRPLMLGHALVAAPLIGGDRVTHLLSAIAAWPESLLWLIAPLHSSASDTVAIVHSFGDLHFWLGLLLPFATLAAAIVCALRGRPIAALGLAWIWLAFLPTANLFPQIHAHAERYLFLSVFGAALVAVDLLDALAARVSTRAHVTITVAIGTLLTLGLAQRTWVRTPDWRSTETLFRADVARDPAYREGRFHLARALVLQQRNGDAAAELALLRAAGPAQSGRWSYVNDTGVRELVCATDVALGRRAEVIASFQQLERSAPSAAADPGCAAASRRHSKASGRRNRQRRCTCAWSIRSRATRPPRFPWRSRASRRSSVDATKHGSGSIAPAETPREPPPSTSRLRQVEKLLR